ncbi:MAG: DNRLRE domain-containing protein [Flavipsychrobacter sp.]
MRNLYIIFLSLPLFCGYTTNGQVVNPGNTVFKEKTFTPSPDDSASANARITFGCDPKSSLFNIENTVLYKPSFDEMTAAAWTHNAHNCQYGLIRFYQKFPQISTIPSHAIIDSAFVILKGKTPRYKAITVGNSYYPNSPYNKWGTNEVEILRNLTNWHAGSITWNNAPTYTLKNSATIPYSTSQGGYDITANVTAMIQDMVSSSNNFGFTFKLQTEKLYRSMLFFNSNAIVTNNRPALKVYYHYNNVSISSRNNEGISNISIFPNPSHKKISINYHTKQARLLNYYIIDIKGQTLIESSIETRQGNNKLDIDLDKIESGTYILQMNVGTDVTRKLFTKI